MSPVSEDSDEAEDQDTSPPKNRTSFHQVYGNYHPHGYHATNSTQLVVLVQDEEDKKYLLGLVNAWHAKQKEVTLSPEQRRAGQQQKPN